ncbi:MAG: DUF547 domain-containing protein [Thermodesulfovibrionia bacterium]
MKKIIFFITALILMLTVLPGAVFTRADTEFDTGNRAENLLQSVKGITNIPGLFSEEYDVNWQEEPGNFPQNFTNTGFKNSVLAKYQLVLRDDWEEDELFEDNILVDRVVLNDGKPRQDIPPEEIAVKLWSSMNALSSAFFDTQKGQVAYERMKRSEEYEEYLKLSYTLKNMDLSELKSREEKIAFWINLYNFIAIHGVIKLGIRDSVKEVRSFFKRIHYQVGDMFFSLDDIEHGILRGSRSYLRFRKRDRKFSFSIKQLEPRLHFALVCVSVSCPPIAFYTPEKLDEELDMAARRFFNSGGVIVGRTNNRVFLSRIFKWYKSEFGKDQYERLQFIAPYLYNRDDRKFLMENGKEIKIEYQDYDWSLNKT